VHENGCRAITVNTFSCCYWKLLKRSSTCTHMYWFDNFRRLSAGDCYAKLDVAIVTVMCFSVVRIRSVVIIILYKEQRLLLSL
jgi:hypothetical protein